MDRWIRDLIASSVSGVLALAQATWERIAWLYATIVTVGLGVKTGWSRLLNAIRHLASHLGGLAGEIYVTVWWTIRVRIPQSVADVRNAIIDWAVRSIDYVDRKLTLFVDTVRDWLVARLNEAIGFVNSLARWVGERIATIVNVLDRVADLVFMLLTSPERMAKWLLAALVREVLSFVDTHADAILEMVRRRSIAYAATAANRIEEVLVRFL